MRDGTTFRKKRAYIIQRTQTETLSLQLSVKSIVVFARHVLAGYNVPNDTGNQTLFMHIDQRLHSHGLWQWCQCCEYLRMEW